MSRIAATCLLGALGLLAGAQAAAADDAADFPNKPITLIVPWAPGGSTDLSARKLADLASKTLGQPIVVENKPGAAGVIGINAVAKAAPDGYTIGAMTYSANTIIPHLRPVPFDTKKDFTFLMQYCEAPMVFAVPVDSPWKTFREFIEDARRNPGKLKYSTPGPLGGQHIFLERVFAQEKVKLNHIPVTGGTEATRQLLGGHLEAALTPDFVPHIQGGKVRGLAVQPASRINALPNVPTFAELGYRLESPNWTGLAAPAGLPPAVQKKLFDAFKKAYADPTFEEFMAKMHLPLAFKDSEGFKATVFRDYESQGQVLKELGLIK